MYLKSIEVNGFKSFAHKMTFKFNSGITGIVGPNGSGKSNVADAVRWVLGEQSAKQLRGAKMEDVIFSGTEMRKPMGSAYVAICMDNSDHSLPIEFDEVTVARRVYRSGESEYLINGSACRRKDIVELFFDTGIGKEGYSIIGQGQIDQILSGKPEDRRELFDEAAGIVKYKKNKAETQKSLEIERENLVRVTDILTELDRQVGPLKRQSERAKEYLHHRDQLKEYDTIHFLLQNKKLTEDLEEVDKNIKIATDELTDAHRALEDAKEKYRKEDQRIEDLSKEIEGISERIHEQELEKEKAEGSIKVLEEQINTERTKESHVSENRTRFEREKTEKESQRKEYEEQRFELQKSIDEITNEKVEKESKVAFLQKEIQDAQEELAQLRHNVASFTNNRINVSGKIEHYETLKEQLRVRIQHLEDQKQELLQQKEIRRKEQKNEEDHLQTLQESKSEINQKLVKKREDFRQKQEELDELQKEISKKQEEFHRAESNYETLRNMSERYDGYGFGIKRVMEQRRTNPGIVGAVADIMKVEQAYEVAVETALGGAIQNIVTDTQQTAKLMIEFLKKNRYGRVTFLPLDAVKPRGRFPREEALREPGVVGLASDLVKRESTYDALFESLLGRILVVNHIDQAIAIARKYNHSFRIVTLDGESFNVGGSMSGGAFKNKSNLLGRSREVSTLGKKVEMQKSKIDALRTKYHQFEQEQKEEQQMMAQYDREIQKMNLDINSSQMEVESLKNRVNEYENQVKEREFQIQQLKQEQEDTDDNVNVLTEKKNDLEDANKNDAGQMQKLEEHLDTLTQQAELHAQEISHVHLKLSQLNQQNDFVLSNIERLDLELQKIYNEMKQMSDESKNVEDTVNQLKEEILSLENSIKEKETFVEDESKRMQTKQAELEESNQKHKKSVQIREEINDKITAFDKENIRLQAIKEKQEEQQQELLNYMWENYEMTYHAAKERMGEEITISLTQVKELIAKEKAEIRSLGPVNVNAIEEYQEVAERYEFLQKQHEDIVTAEQHLVGLIGELEDAMRNQFNEKFKEIKTMFQSVFQELFGGGYAKLELTEDDVLESGIRIIAQPPGKKLQNMMQLSGGEKALTAISLLFAIQNLKPSPFCLLDEIEAALDDSNVVRFANYLHKLTQNTQFIVITHRRGTMTSADVLYGITMQEKGVSTLVSVNLIEDDLDE